MREGAWVLWTLRQKEEKGIDGRFVDESALELFIYFPCRVLLAARAFL